MALIRLLRQRDFALLWWGALISLTGDWMLRVALPIYVYEQTGSTVATAAMIIASRLPVLLLGSVAGVFVDRWDRRRTLVAGNILLMLALLPLLAVRSEASLWLVYAVTVVQSSLIQFVQPAESALLPRLVGRADLVPANALNSLNNNLARLIGPPLGGLTAVYAGLGGVAVVDAATYLTAAGLIALIASRARPESDAESEALAEIPASTAPGALAAVWREWRAGLALVRRDRLLATIFLVTALPILGEGMMGAVFVAFVRDTFGGAQQLGWLVAAQAVGGIAGGAVVGVAARRIPPSRLIGGCAVAFGLIDLITFNYPAYISGIGLGLTLMALVGVPSVGYGAGILTLLQAGVEDRYRGRIFAAYLTTAALLMLAGTVLGGALAGALGVLTFLNLSGLSYVLAGLLLLALLPRHAAAVDAAFGRAPREAVPART